MAKKIILVGRAGVGKTSIKKVVFEGYEPKNLLKNPLSPTRGIESSIYNWMDLELGLLDTSGQELPVILKEEGLNLTYFTKSDVILYIIDYPNWDQYLQTIKEDIQKLQEIIKNNAMQTRLILFLHKVDESPNFNQKSFNKIKKKFLNSLNLGKDLEIYASSINEQFIYNTYKAFFDILGTLSSEVRNLKELIDNNVQKYTKLLCILINPKNSIVLQSMTDDFNPEIIREMYRRIGRATIVSDKNVSIAIQYQNTDIGPIIQNIFKNTDEIIHPHLKNIIYVYENIPEDTIQELMLNMRKKISKFYMKWAEKNLFIK